MIFYKESSLKKFQIPIERVFQNISPLHFSTKEDAYCFSDFYIQFSELDKNQNIAVSLFSSSNFKDDNNFTASQKLEIRLKNLMQMQAGRFILLLLMNNNQFDLNSINIMCLDFGISLMLMDSIEEINICLKNLLIKEKYQKKKQKMKKQQKPSANQAEEFLRLFPHFSEDNCSQIASQYQTIEALAQANKKDLIKIKGIGEQKAQQILDFFQWPFEISQSAKKRNIEQHLFCMVQF